MRQHDNDEWMHELSAHGPLRDLAIQRLFDLLLQAARKEVARRAFQLHLRGPELDDIASQATADAVVAILGKLGQFRGESRFTTWAYKFIIYEVSTKVTRHFWGNSEARSTVENWEFAPARYEFDPADEFEWSELMTAVRRAVDTALTPHQREVFSAVVMSGVPVDVVAQELGSNRNAVYKVLFDARRKLREVLVGSGYLDDHLGDRHD